MATRPDQTSPAVRAGIYTRISWDPEGQRAGVERQRVDCEALCADRAWEIAGYFEDNDRSAYSGKRRPACEQMLLAADDRRLDAVVTWHNDRLHRSPRELETFIDLVERSGVRVAVVSGGDYDLTTPEGRFTARIVGAVARKESEDRSRRVRRKHLELAEQGRPASHLGWGVRNEDERELVREAAGRVLAGQGLITIARDWNSRGVPGTTASPWTAPTLRKVLLSARIAGLREHGADPRGRVLGALTPAVWEGAIDRRTWDHVRAVLLNPERLTLGNTPTKYLLMGLIFCGVCGGRMFSRPRDDHTFDDEFYVRGAIGERRYRSIRTRLEREVERLHTQVDRYSKQRIVLHPDPRSLWAEADFGQRRELVRLVVERVRVMPARRGARFDPARVRLDIPLLQVVASDG